MNFFVFRNNTIERFFPKEYAFSGYDDISMIPVDADAYVWFYHSPIASDTLLASEEIRSYEQKFNFVLSQIDKSKTIIAITMEEFYCVPPVDNDFSVRSSIVSYNANLFQAEKENPNLKVFDFSEFTRNYSIHELLDWRFYFLSQMGMNPKLTKDFQAWWNKKLDSISLKRKKCLVLDLDNTLWGGVLGEDGVSGIQIGGDYPGKAYAFFQKSLLQLSKSGVILTVCSKNNESDVLEAWAGNPFIILKKEHFSAYRINWQDKATNIRELSEELNIGLDSFVFVDDNPTERELVKQMLPMVSVPDFPAQPYEFPQFFQTLVNDYFKIYSVTEEDKKKTEQYKANAARAQAQSSYADFDSFLKSLDICITVEEANEFNISRIAQLTQKTNQFNLTTQRYTDSDIKRFLNQGWKIWCIGVSDRFGDNGITGALLFDGANIDTFLLSCRVLGKGIELAFVKYILQSLLNQGQQFVYAQYLPTAKNMAVRDFYERCGFECTGEDENGKKTYSIELKNADLQIENHYRIIAK